MSPIEIDHVICAVQDLDAAAARFLHEYGLASVPGGHHPGWGTANRIVPLGRQYVELVGVVDASTAVNALFGRVVLEAAAHGDRVIGWAVATDDIDRVAARLDLEVIAAEREAPDGSTLRWRLAGVERATSTGAFPFFIEWGLPLEQHPGRILVAHRREPRGITRIDVGADEDAIAAWLGVADLPVRVKRRGPRGLLAVAIDAADCEIVLS